MSSNPSKGYKFNIQDGVVSAVYEIKNGRVKLEGMDRDETWAVNGNQVVKTENEHGRLETTVYADVDGDGVYTKVGQRASDSKHRGSDTDAHRDRSGNDGYDHGAVANHDLYGGEGHALRSGGDLHSGAGNSTHDAFTLIANPAALSTQQENGALWLENGVLYASNDRDLAPELQIEVVGASHLTVTDFIF